jgi:hypothetical protein
MYLRANDSEGREIAMFGEAAFTIFGPAYPFRDAI